MVCVIKHIPTSKNISKVEPKKVRKNNDASIIEYWVSHDEEEDGSKTKPEKKSIIPTAAKIEKPVRKPVKYAEMYRSQRPMGKELECCPNQQRKRIVSGNNYNKMDNDYYSKTTHPSAHKHMAPRAVLMKTGTDKSKITRKQSKASKHGHENQKSTKRSQRSKAEARKVKPQSNP
ncbi:hypothetical protein Tco_0296324, partial [Tanacetum coccineum]